MSGGLKPYPDTKDSGVPWLEAIPEHWEVLPARAVYKPKLRKNFGMSRKTVLSLSYGRIVVKPEEKLRGLVPESFETYQLVDPGDIIIRTTDLQNDRSSLRIGFSNHQGIITSAYMCLGTTDRFLPKFGYEFLNTYDLLKIIYGFGSGLRQSLDFSDIKHMPVLAPPLDEQAAIVRFLDHADGRIRRYVAAKKELIALLNEQKQAIVYNAVTRGLDANVRLKASGVEWLGDVPEHWSVMRNKAMMTPRRRTVGLRSTDFTLLSLTLRGVIPRDLENPEGKFPADFGTYQVVEPGELVFCLFDMDETPRTVGIAPVRGMVTGAYSVFGCIDRDVARFLYYFYLAMDAQKRLRPFYTGLRKVVQNDTFMSIRVAIPRREEMRTILSTIAAEVAQIDDAIEHSEREVHLVQEFRTRLISDVVTGKLDVRQAAEQLPEVVEDAGPLDDDGILDGDESEDQGDLDAVVGEVVA